MEKSQIAFAHLLRDAGYATCIAGKWPLGAKDPGLPKHFGFDEHVLWAHLGRGGRDRGRPADVAVTLDGRRYPGTAAPITRHELKAALPARAVAEITAPGARTVTWLVRQTGLAFQVRNPTIEDKGAYWQVTRLRNKFSQQEEIIFVPLAAVGEPWVHQRRHVNRARLYRWNAAAKLLRVVPEEVFGVIELDIVMATRPARVTGAEMWEHADGRLRVWARGQVPVEIFGS